jgi:hypothetical protein
MADIVMSGNAEDNGQQQRVIHSKSMLSGADDIRGDIALIGTRCDILLCLHISN